ncbi:hypothetical protein Pint_28290 [Pistacia integerrima]|uniref:Uncharacterized protein n=1 Tax=Pistacia integerrima TaxID=434235 RepID=A0ACC0YT87_9ROSI|nr:hypothetical protein Pint_28290 [Pistacia integerrima]
MCQSDLSFKVVFDLHLATAFAWAASIILGSSSMARREILAEMGYEFSIITADIDESSIRREKPEELVMALAEAKDAFHLLCRCHHTKASKYKSIQGRSSGNIVNHSRHSYFLLLNPMDFEVVVYKGTIREKPSGKEEAREFIKGYSGSHAAVVGSVLITNLKTGTRKGGWERAEVYFHDIPGEVIDNLIDEEITLNVAGGLMLENPLTLPFVEAVVCLPPPSACVVGGTDTVMGLSKVQTEKLIREALL